MDLSGIKLTPNKKLHSREHLLAEDLSKMLGEAKRFSAYLGIAHRYHESDLRGLARYVLEKENLPLAARGKYFFAALRGLIRIKTKPQKRKLKKKHQVQTKRKAAENPPHNSYIYSSTKMSKKLPIIHTPDLVLRQEAREIPLEEIKSKKIQELIKNMKETLKVTPDGVGLAAPQVNESLRLFIVSDEAEEIDRAELRKKSKEHQESDDIEPYPKREWNYYVFINPVVKKISKQKITGTEGCLSAPGKYGPVTRQGKITVEAHDERGKKFTRGAGHFFARVLQHELDHLRGVLFIDKAEKLFDVEKK